MISTIVTGGFGISGGLTTTIKDMTTRGYSLAEEIAIIGATLVRSGLALKNISTSVQIKTIHTSITAKDIDTGI